jgi:hypothetical protein
MLKSTVTMLSPSNLFDFISRGNEFTRELHYQVRVSMVSCLGQLKYRLLRFKLDLISCLHSTIPKIVKAFVIVNFDITLTPLNLENIYIIQALVLL